MPELRDVLDEWRQVEHDLDSAVGSRRDDLERRRARLRDEVGRLYDLKVGPRRPAAPSTDLQIVPALDLERG